MQNINRNIILDSTFLIMLFISCFMVSCSSINLRSNQKNKNNIMSNLVYTDEDKSQYKCPGNSNCVRVCTKKGITRTFKLVCNKDTSDIQERFLKIDSADDIIQREHKIDESLKNSLHKILCKTNRIKICSSKNLKGIKICYPRSLKQKLKGLTKLCKLVKDGNGSETLTLCSK